MALYTREPGTTLSGQQLFRSHSLVECLKSAGFDPTDPGCGCILQVSDMHMSQSPGPYPYISREINKMFKELRSLGIITVTLDTGDFFTNLAPAPGWPMYISNGIGAIEAGWINREYSKELKHIAPIYPIVGNHDTGPEEVLVPGEFALANITHFTERHPQFTVAGLPCIGLSGAQGNAWLSGQEDLVRDFFNNLPGDTDVLVAMHEPGGLRAADWHATMTLYNLIEELSVPDVHVFCGHTHEFSQSYYRIGSVRMRKFICASGSYKDPTRYSPGAQVIAIRNGRIVAIAATTRTHCYWELVKFHDDSMLSDRRYYFAPLDGYTRLADYIGAPMDGYIGTGFQGDLRAFAQNAEGESNWRWPSSWFSYVRNLHLKIPLEQGATRAWVCGSQQPSFIELSNDGTTWTPVTVPVTQPEQMYVFDIPAGLQAGPDLHFRIGDYPLHMSGFGLLQ